MTPLHRTLASLLMISAGLAGRERSQAQATPEAVPAKAVVCAACHGADGKPLLPAYPILAGQTSRYMVLELRDFQAGRRTDALMSPMAAGLTRDEMQELADYFARQKPPAQNFAADPDKAKLGKLKADETLCTMCHLGSFSGQNEIPRVGGQNYDYIIKQLTAFKARTRTNDAGSMTSVASTLNDQDIVNLAHYLVGL